MKSLTAKELITLLKSVDGDREIFLASDEEGNTVLPIYSLSDVEGIDDNGRAELVLYPFGSNILN